MSSTPQSARQAVSGSIFDGARAQFVGGSVDAIEASARHNREAPATEGLRRLPRKHPKAASYDASRAECHKACEAIDARKREIRAAGRNRHG